MSIKQAIEARALKLADSRLEDERGTYEWSLDAEITLRECAAALAALRSMPAEPVAIYHGRCTIDCGEHGHHDLELLKMIPKGSKLYTTPHTAPLSDAEILALWSGSDTALRPVLGGRKVIAFARAIERAVLGRGGEQ